MSSYLGLYIKMKSFATDYKSKYYLLNPYVNAQVGPVAIQSELSYYFGKAKEYDNAGNTDVKYDSMAYRLLD
ncbi:MAG: hypothetical protein A4E71_02538 [Smithella sp. PtaU1.Bin162]|nr:MAG: hypothetical protein A4E71_02538 [Smithella sp. PtaU1.Bin162]